MNLLIALLAGTAIAALMIPRFGLMIQRGQDRSVQAVTAGEFQDLLSAARTYIEAHYTELASQVAVGSTSELPLGQLPLLPNFGQQNPYGQTWHVYVQQPASGQISALVVSRDGQQLDLSALTRIAALGGSHAGYVGADNILPTVNSQTAIGANGGWRLSLAGSPVNPGAGHFVGLASGTAGAQYNSDALYRDAVPNHPELSTMNNTLNMGGNDIANANTISGVRGRFTNNIATNSLDPNSGYPSGWAGGAHVNDLYAHGSIGAGPMNGPAAAWMNANGDAGFNHSVSVGWTLSANQIVLPQGNSLQIGNQYLYGDGNNIAMRTGGTFYLQHYDGSAADENVSTLSAEKLVHLNGTAAPGEGCNSGGLTAQNDGSGRLLNCVNGTWQSVIRAPFGYYVPPTTNGRNNYNVVNPYTGGFSCQAGTQDMQSAVLWYGDYGFSALHLCIAPQ